MKRLLIPVCIISFVLAVMQGCSKSFLEVEPKETPVREGYVNNLTTCQEFLHGIYASLSESFVIHYNTIYPELVADNLKPATSGQSALFSHYSWNQQATFDRSMRPSSQDKNMNALWTMGYQIMHSCNYLVEKAGAYRSENPSKADNIRGQAIALRAMVMHTMLNVFAQPPVFTATASHPGIPYSLSADFTQMEADRPTVAQNYQQLIADLTAAIALLYESQSSRFFISKNTAKALLARVYLYQRNYELAKKSAQEVMANIPLLTGAAYPGKLFTADDREALLQIPPSVSATGNFSTTFPSLYFRRTIQFYASDDIANLLRENPTDTRNNWLTTSGSNYTIVKFPTGVVTGITTAENGYYLTLIRCSEMYLVAAEAYGHLGNMDSAQYFVNEIRQRADPQFIAVTATGEQLLDTIAKERRKELCFEGMRMYDLLRTGKPVHRSSAVSPAPVDLPFPSNKAIAPLPALDVNRYGIKQNLDY